jgi:hypothetical protein
MFAYDTSTLKANNNLDELFNDINAQLRNLASWFRCNRMGVDTSKTTFIFKTKGKRIDDNVDIHFNDNQITVLKTQTYGIF